MAIQALYPLDPLSVISSTVADKSITIIVRGYEDAAIAIGRQRCNLTAACAVTGYDIKVTPMTAATGIQQPTTPGDMP